MTKAMTPLLLTLYRDCACRERAESQGSQRYVKRVLSINAARNEWQLFRLVAEMVMKGRVMSSVTRRQPYWEYFIWSIRDTRDLLILVGGLHPDKAMSNSHKLQTRLPEEAFILFLSSMTTIRQEYGSQVGVISLALLSVFVKGACVSKVKLKGAPQFPFCQ